MSSKTKKITTLNEEQNLAVDIEFQEYSVDGKTNVDFGTGNGRMRQRTKDILHVSNELKKLNKKSKAVKFIIDWTGENIVITCPEKNIELNFVLHHSTSLESGNSMLKEMGRYNHEIENFIYKVSTHTDSNMYSKNLVSCHHALDHLDQYSHMLWLRIQLHNLLKMRVQNLVCGLFQDSSQTHLALNLY